MMTAFPNRREVPVEWTDLSPLAIRASEGLQTGDRTACTDLYVEASQLSDERVEVNRYFGTGFAVCELAKAASVPENYQRLVKKVADELEESSQYNHSSDHYGPYRGLRVADLNDGAARTASDWLQPTVSANLEPSVKLLTNIFDATYLRRTTRRVGIGQDEQLIDHLANGAPWAELNVVRTAFAGPLNLFRRFLETYITADAIDLDEVNPVVGEMIDVNSLKITPGLIKAARMASRIRADEFSGPLLDKLLVADGPGMLTFDTSELSAEPRTIIDRKTELTAPLHHDRLECPALQVTGSIPLFMNMMPAILQTVRQKELANRSLVFG